MSMSSTVTVGSGMQYQYMEVGSWISTPTAAGNEVARGNVIHLGGESLDPQVSLFGNRAKGIRDSHAEVRFAEPAALRVSNQVVQTGILCVALRPTRHRAPFRRPPSAITQEAKWGIEAPRNPPARIPFHPFPKGRTSSNEERQE